LPTANESHRFQQLDAIAERVVDVDARVAGQWLIVHDVCASGFQAFDQLGEAFHLKCRVSFGCGTEVFLHTGVELELAALEPDAAASSEVRRLGPFWDAEQIAVEASCRRFAVRRDSDLDVVESNDSHLIPLKRIGD
jgi:hypothetical protein